MLPIRWSRLQDLKPNQTNGGNLCLSSKSGGSSDEVTSTGQQSVASLNEPLNATGTSMVNAPAGAFGSTSRVASAAPSDALARDTVAALAQTSPVSAQPLLNQSQPATVPQTVSERACAKYSSSDLAQSDFLAQGGPRRDRLGLDPDGDGFACAWNPQPFRAAVGG